jgi:hypothetical protein
MEVQAMVQRCIPVMATGVRSFVFTTECQFISLTHSSKDQIPGHLGQLSESMHVFFSLFLDEYRVNRKTFARGGHYLVADWITSFLIRFQTSSLQRIIWKDSTRLGSSKRILTKSTYMCRGIPSLSLAGNIILTVCNVFF